MTVMSKQLSLCTACGNRLWQLQQTLGSNLASLEPDMEIVLVDYGSTDGLSDWVWQNFEGAIESGMLTFFEVKNDVAWNCPKAKNLAHRLAKGDYLFNADADNFFTPNDLGWIKEAAAMGLPSQQWSQHWPDGSYGRIGLPRALFWHIGGYNESLLPMGGQDIDLIRRLGMLDDRIFLMPSPEQLAVPNSIAEKMSQVVPLQYDAHDTYEQINRTNLAFADLFAQINGPVLRGGFASFRGLLNGEEITIDGFNTFSKSAS